MFSVIMLVFELELFMMNDLDKPFSSAIYFTMITLSTIGYGDYCPVNMPARTTVMCMALWGGVLLALFVGTVSNVFAM